MRVCSFNIKTGAKLAGVLETLEAIPWDVCALQEVDVRTSRVGGVDVLGVLASEFKASSVWRPTVPIGGGQYGIAILSKTAPTVTASGFYQNQSGEQRGWVAALVDGVVVWCTHLSTSAVRAAQMAELATRVQAIPGHHIVAGDFNQSDVSVFGMKAATPNIPTFGDEKLDEILVSGGLNIAESLVGTNYNSSDHLPVFADVRKKGMSLMESALLLVGSYAIFEVAK